MSPREESPELEGLSGAARLEALRERARLNRTVRALRGGALCASWPR